MTLRTAASRTADTYGIVPEEVCRGLSGALGKGREAAPAVTAGGAFIRRYGARLSATAAVREGVALVVGGLAMIAAGNRQHQHGLSLLRVQGGA